MKPPFEAPKGSHWESQGNIHNLVRDNGQPLLCDFCAANNAPPKWVYHCDSFRAMDIIRPANVIAINAIDDWASCDSCSELIDAGKWNELAEKSVRSYLKKSGSKLPLHILLPGVRDIQSRFARFKYGKKERL